MKELTQQELIRVYIAYLPYDLKVQRGDHLLTMSWIIDDVANLTYDNGNESFQSISNLKPLLYPLSMLTKEIEHEGETFVPIQRLSKEFEMNVIEHCFLEQNAGAKGFDWLRSTSYPVVQRLIEWHFNIFGLDESQYINKATLKTK